MTDIAPPCEDLLGEARRRLWCGDTDLTGHFVCRRVRGHKPDQHVGRNDRGGIHQWPATAAAAAPELPVYGVAPDNVHHDDVVTAKELWEAIRPQFDPNDAWEYEELGPLLRTFVAVLDRRRAEIAADAGVGDLRQRIVAELGGMVSEFIHPNEFDGYDVDYGDLADIALAVVQPELEHQAAEITTLRQRKQADLDELKRRLGLAGKTLTAHCKRRDEQDAEIARLRTTNASLLAMLERMETLHVTFYGPGGEELHPDWCRECRVDTMRADRDAARRERDEMREQRDLVKVELGLERGKVEGATAAADRWMREAERPAIPAGAVNTWQLEADLSTAIAATGEAGGGYNDMASSAMHVALQHIRGSAPVSGSDTAQDVVNPDLHITWRAGDLALDSTDFVWWRDQHGWRPITRCMGPWMSDGDLGRVAGPLMRLAGLPPEMNKVGSVPAEVAARLRGDWQADVLSARSSSGSSAAWQMDHDSDFPPAHLSHLPVLPPVSSGGDTTEVRGEH